MTQQDAACCALVVMPSVTEESSSTSFMLSTEQLAGSDPVPIDRVSNVPEDGGPTEVTDHSILMELGLVDRYGRLSREYIRKTTLPAQNEKLTNSPPITQSPIPPKVLKIIFKNILLKFSPITHSTKSSKNNFEKYIIKIFPNHPSHQKF